MWLSMQEVLIPFVKTCSTSNGGNSLVLAARSCTCRCPTLSESPECKMQQKKSEILPIFSLFAIQVAGARYHYHSYNHINHHLTRARVAGKLAVT